MLIDGCLRDGAERWTGNLVQLPEHRACSEDRFFGCDGLFAIHRNLRRSFNGTDATPLTIDTFSWPGVSWDTINRHGRLKK